MSTINLKSPEIARCILNNNYKQNKCDDLKLHFAITFYYKIQPLNLIGYGTLLNVF